MSSWPNKFVIGLTGNIATGKSVVRKMLEHLGAYGIDADALAHRAIAKGAPGYQPLVDTFGQWILRPDGEIDRRKLGRLAFADPTIMRQLEEIIHPLVRQAVHLLARRSKQPVIVIEAIKLLEGELHKHCDSIWVVVAPPEQQLKRLVSKRGLSPTDARLRITMQGDPQAKIAAADVVIYNDGSFEKTWEQVRKAWRLVVPEQYRRARPSAVARSRAAAGSVTAHWAVKKAGPKDAAAIAEFLSQHTGRKVRRAEVLAAFGEKAYLALSDGEQVIGLLGWQVENLVARVNEWYLSPQVPLEPAAKMLLEAMEAGSRELQCEIALLFLPPDLARHSLWQQLDYHRKDVSDLTMRAWQEAVRESQPPRTVMLVKVLRSDRVMQPL